MHSLLPPAIATTRLLLNLLCWESLCITWSDEETWICAGADEGSRISINLNSPPLFYVLLLNLAFCIWMYSCSVNISEVWNQMLLKNPIYFELMLPCVCSFIKSGFSCLNSQCENLWNWETKYVAEKKKTLIRLSSCFLVTVV